MSAGPQTPNHILQSCPTLDALRRQTWPSPVDAHRKLWGPVEIAADSGLGLTHRTEDLAWLRTQKKKKVGLVSVHCDWARRQVGSAISISVWQHVNESEQIGLGTFFFFFFFFFFFCLFVCLFGFVLN